MTSLTALALAWSLAFGVPPGLRGRQVDRLATTKREVERHKLRDMPNDRAWDAEQVLGRRRLRSGQA